MKFSTIVCMLHILLIALLVLPEYPDTTEIREAVKTISVVISMAVISIIASREASLRY